MRYLETHLVEKLKEKIFTSLEELNAETQKIVAALNSRNFQNKSFSRKDAFEKYDKPCMKPLPGGIFTVCDYKSILRIPNNSAILKATASEIKICDRYNRLICRHKRSYKEFPLYITDDNHLVSWS